MSPVSAQPAQALAPVRVLELIRDRLAEEDAKRHVPLNILADLDQLIDEALTPEQTVPNADLVEGLKHSAAGDVVDLGDFTQYAADPLGDYYEGLEEGANITHAELTQLLQRGPGIDMNPTRILAATPIEEMRWWQDYLHRVNTACRGSIEEIQAKAKPAAEVEAGNACGGVGGHIDGPRADGRGQGVPPSTS